MQGQKLTRGWLRVDWPQGVHILTHLKQRRLLEPFIGEERTLRSVAEQTGTKLNLVHYYAKRFEAARLLRVTREQARRGRAIKFYRGVAEKFFVPYDALAQDTMEDQSVAYENPLRELMKKSITQSFGELQHAHGGPDIWGRFYERTPTGEFIVNSKPDPDIVAEFDLEHALLHATPFAFGESWGFTHLGPEEARAFMKELIELRQRFLKSETGQQRYLFHLALAPVEG